MSMRPLSREDWAGIRDAWNAYAEQDALRQQKEHNMRPNVIPPAPHDPTREERLSGFPLGGTSLAQLIHRETARTLYVLLHQDDATAARMADMNEADFVACCEQIMSEDTP